MNRNELLTQKEKEYALLNGLTKNYRMPIDSLGEYVSCLDRIRAINKQIECFHD